jgi:uncharacterized protein YggE
MRPFLTILALLAFPSAAVAQQMQPMPRVAPGAPGASELRGITVSGTATKKIPATRAQVSIYFFSRAGGITATTLQPAVDALIKSGASKEDVSLPASLGSPANLNNATIVAILPNPTVAEMQSGISNVGAAIAGMNGISVGNVQVLLQTDNCGDSAESVRAAAIKNARAKAEATAADLQVHVGPVLNVITNDQVNPSGSCVSQYTVGQNNNGAIASPEDYVSVSVYANVTITYAIKT